jgi:putative flippase GtrA
VDRIDRAGRWLLRRIGLARLVPLWDRFWRYAAGSAATAVLSQFVLLLLYSTTHLLDPRDASIAATLAGIPPSYWLNRSWAWRRRDRSSLVRDVLPYLAMSLVSLVASTWAVDVAHAHALALGASRLDQDIIVQGVYLGSFVALWFGKFAFMQVVLFGTHGRTIDASSPTATLRRAGASETSS